MLIHTFFFLLFPAFQMEGFADLLYKIYNGSFSLQKQQIKKAVLLHDVTPDLNTFIALL